MRVSAVLDEKFTKIPKRRVILLLTTGLLLIVIIETTPKGRGLFMVRRIGTNRPMFAECIYKYFFLVNFSLQGGFVVPGVGINDHSHHYRFGDNDSFLPPRLLTKYDKTSIRDLGEGNAENSITQNVLFVKIGQYVLRNNINHLKKTVS